MRDIDAWNHWADVGERHTISRVMILRYVKTEYLQSCYIPHVEFTILTTLLMNYASQAIINLRLLATGTRTDELEELWTSFSNIQIYKSLLSFLKRKIL